MNVVNVIVGPNVIDGANFISVCLHACMLACMLACWRECHRWSECYRWNSWLGDKGH